MADERSDRFARIHSAREKRDVTYLREAVARDPGWRSTAARYLAELGAHEAIPELLRLLEVEKATDRAAAATALGHLRAEEAVSRLTEVAQSDPAEATRSYAVGALGLIGDRRSIEPLTRLLDDPEPWIRVSAIKALARFHDPEADSAIKRAVSKESRWRWRYRYWRAMRTGRSTVE